MSKKGRQPHSIWINQIKTHLISTINILLSYPELFSLLPCQPVTSRRLEDPLPPSFLFKQSSLYLSIWLQLLLTNNVTGWGIFCKPGQLRYRPLPNKVLGLAQYKYYIHQPPRKFSEKFLKIKATTIIAKMLRRKKGNQWIKFPLLHTTSLFCIQ